MYKYLLTLSLFAVLLLLVSCPTKAQQLKNPDGDCVSIHFTPYFTDATFKVLEKEGEIEQQFNYNLMVKMPLSSTITASIFYKSEELELNFIAIKKKSYGFTISVWIE